MQRFKHLAIKKPPINLTGGFFHDIFSYQAAPSTSSSSRLKMMKVKNDAEILVTWEFSQGGMEGKCAADVLSALAKRLNELSGK